MKYFLIVILFGFVDCHCAKPEKKFESPSLKDVIILDNGKYCEMETPLVFKDKLILMITNYESKEGWINCYDKHTLKLMWTWREAAEEFGAPAKGFGNESYIFNGILCIAQSNLSYGIDIISGKTIWKNREDETAFSAIYGNNTIITNTHIKEDNTHEYIKVATVGTGKWKNIFDHIKKDTLSIHLKVPHPFSWKGKNYVTFVSTKWMASAQTRINRLNLYNLTDDCLEWTSDTIPLHHPLSGTPGVQPEFEDGQILLANDAIYSYNVEDGSLEWWKWYGNKFVFSTHLTTADGKVFGNNENQFIIGLDVHTGKEQFNTTTGGSASKIVYHDEQCYLSSVTVGGENHLIVIDANDGTIVHDVTAPFRKKNRKWVFERSIAVDPETDLVYTSDHRSLLVYQFE